MCLINFRHIFLALSFKANFAGVHIRHEYALIMRAATALTVSISIDCPSSSDIIPITYLIASNPQSTNTSWPSHRMYRGRSPSESVLWQKLENQPSHSRHISKYNLDSSVNCPLIPFRVYRTHAQK